MAGAQAARTVPATAPRALPAVAIGPWSAAPRHDCPGRGQRRPVEDEQRGEPLRIIDARNDLELGQPAGQLPQRLALAADDTAGMYERRVERDPGPGAVAVQSAEAECLCRPVAIRRRARRAGVVAPRERVAVALQPVQVARAEPARVRPALTVGHGALTRHVTRPACRHS
jgi:hypothetical protein